MENVGAFDFLLLGLHFPQTWMASLSYSQSFCLVFRKRIQAGTWMQKDIITLACFLKKGKLKIALIQPELAWTQFYTFVHSGVTQQNPESAMMKRNYAQFCSPRGNRASSTFYHRYNYWRWLTGWKKGRERKNQQPPIHREKTDEARQSESEIRELDNHFCSCLRFYYRFLQMIAWLIHFHYRTFATNTEILSRFYYLTCYLSWFESFCNDAEDFASRFGK